MKLKRTITIEFDQGSGAKPAPFRESLWCELCRAKTEFLDAAPAAEVVKAIRVRGLTVRKEDLHFYTAIKGKVLICLNSILKRD